MKVDIVLLGILSGGDFFGYEIIKIIKSVMVDIANVTTGTLYYKLKGLERKGYLSSAREREGRRPQRLRYSLTDSGRRAFQALALENIDGESRPYWNYLSSLFFVQYLPADDTREALLRKKNKHETTLRRLLATRKKMKDRGYPFHALMLLDHGLRHLRVDIAWLEEFAGRLDTDGDSLTGFSFSPEDWRRHLASGVFEEKG